MAFNVQTPQRPLPGAYFMTPALSRPQASSAIQPPLFRSNSASSLHGATDIGQTTSTTPTAPAEVLQPIERAARTINEALAQETRYPELDNYVGQGISSDYDIPLTSAWAPFQKSKVYDIPDKIFEQYNEAQVSTMMGLFAELGHAWMSIDNSLYLWDYSHPNPELIGFEEQPNSITAVKLVSPRPGVFVSSINYLLVVATTSEIFLIGLSCKPNPAGNKIVTLYQTRMSLSIKGMDVNVIEGSIASGRIFFSGRHTHDVYEIIYQSDRGNHAEYVVQMAIDDTRNLLYTLSSRSTIRTFHLKPNNGLDLAITQTLSYTFSNVRHMVSRTELIDINTSIVSISPIPANEASKLHLMAITSTGCRLFLSATSSFGWTASESGAPTSMQVQHVKFPPPDSSKLSTQRSPSQLVPYQANEAIDTSSQSLIPTRKATRYAPGYCLCFTNKHSAGAIDTLFISSPDSGRIARPQDQTQISRYREHGTWMSLDSRAEDIGLITPPFAAAPTPAGFGNELAIQFDKLPTEIAILTNTGVHIIRRKRLVDIFAATIRFGRGDDGLEGEVKKFVRLYGRGETTATALAVACGQGLDVMSDSRVAKVTDPEILEISRKVFIEFGGKPILNENSVLDQSIPAIDNVRPSPRHEGTALYISRLVRSIWKAPVIREGATPMGGLTVSPTVPLDKLRDIQRDLAKLQEFLNTNKSFIDGLSGPESLMRINTKQEEIALQAEHRALSSLVCLIDGIIEGISFVLVLFDDRVDEIILSLQDTFRQQARELTYERLFATKSGKELAKELVKAIVNRSIANGSNVDTIAEALRRRCGSFCSADDAIIFKAQEQLKKASEAGGTSDLGRNLLRESLRLFEQVASSLKMEALKAAVVQFTSMQFYAGAIQLALSVARESDRGNQALAYIAAGLPEQDDRRRLLETRTNCYRMIFDILTAVDQAASQAPEKVDGHYTRSARLRSEAYSVVHTSEDEVFQNSLYDWYIDKGWNDRLLEVESPYIIPYLKRKFTESSAFADLLWNHYAQREQYYEAAKVQLELAKTEIHNDRFRIPLEKRIEYLSRAKANASTVTTGIGRQSRQTLLHEISELLEVANIQDDLLQRLKVDSRLTPEKREEVLAELNGPIIGLTELFNEYADKASYFDICLLIYQAADHRNPSHIKASWQNLILQVHNETLEKGEPQPYEAVAETVRSMDTLVRMLKVYSFEYQRDVGPQTWVVDTFLDLHVPYETILPVLDGMLYHDEAPFTGNNRRFIASDILFLIRRWYEYGVRSGRLFGGEHGAANVTHMLGVLIQTQYLSSVEKEEARILMQRIDMVLR
ncbi:hypothetical protein GP486_000703 [Trichoglossum hirsutum]|uniref:Non-repetitive nucleoporin n=1 Tax=Trichoglossum hirsutum TaxID=265104 RepID=A0A9P8LHB0_9PEZI|nr:hypothetical protein GP486_000703 [Trichoglossum hirsutum]